MVCLLPLKLLRFVPEDGGKTRGRWVCCWQRGTGRDGRTSQTAKSAEYPIVEPQPEESRAQDVEENATVDLAVTVIELFAPDHQHQACSISFLPCRSPELNGANHDSITAGQT